MIRLAAVGAALALRSLPPAMARAPRRASIDVEQPWARATAGATTTGAVYMTIHERSTVPDKLVAATSPVAESIEIHAHTMEDGVMRMRQVAVVDVTSSTPATFAPGHFHLMLVGLKHRLVQGETFPLSLSFENAGVVEVTVTIEGPGAMGPGRA